MIRVLYVNHKKENCGVYEFGKHIGKALIRSEKFNFKYCECNSIDEFKEVFDAFRPKVIIYNFHPTTLGWIYPVSKFDVPLTYKVNAIHIGTIHEVFQKLADNTNDEIFDFHIAPDPTLVLKNPIVFKTGRLLPRIPSPCLSNEEIPVIGSFGFATPGKGFDKVVRLVQDSFDEAIIKLNIPFAKFGDENGENAGRIAEECRNVLYKKSIQLIIDHDYLEDDELLAFLSANTINVFLYDDMPERGISSAVDWAIACGRPIAISNSRLFRHLLDCRPGICIEENNLRQIINNGVTPLKRLWNDWNEETIIWDYERIVSKSVSTTNKSSLGKRNRMYYFLRKALKKIGYIRERKNSLNTWTKKEDEYVYTPKINVDYEPFLLSEYASLNRILDNEARQMYAPAIKFLDQHLPDLVIKKIREANVQQAFVFDTTIRLSKKFINPKILAVGTFEDTAAEGLKLLNYDIDFIDPVLNYDLHTFLNKPGTRRETYDLIISTSVIEHVEHDEQFIMDLEYLLKPEGNAVLTCDYNDQYTIGDDIPGVDYRFYTQIDLRERLMKMIPKCRLTDTPQWDCKDPDFVFENKYRYTFATLVFEKFK